jgi:hypothetical protein
LTLSDTVAQRLPEIPGHHHPGSGEVLATLVLDLHPDQVQGSETGWIVFQSLHLEAYPLNP